MRREVTNSNENVTEQLTRLDHLNQLLSALRGVSRILYSETDLIQLCQKVCQSLSQTRGYVTVWIGRADFAKNRVKPLAFAGAELNAFLKSPITLDNQPTAQGPAGIALREGRAVVFDDLANDPRFAPWREDVLPSGAASMAALPLKFRDQILGVLVVKARQVRAFDDGELHLLNELAGDVARAWHGLENELLLANSQKNLETLVEAIPDAVFFKDGEGRWLITNLAAQQIFQTDKRPWRGRTDAELAGDLPELKAAHENCAVSDELAWTARKLVLGEERILLPDGSVCLVEVFKQPVFHPDGRRKGLVIVARDITKRKVDEDRIRLLQTAVNAAANGIVMTDTTGKTIWVNRAFTAMSGYGESEVLGKNLRMLNSGQQSPEFYRTMWNTIRAGKYWEGELTNRRKDGTIYQVAMTISPVQSASGDITHFIAIHVDISQRKQAELDIRQINEQLTRINTELEQRVIERTRQFSESEEKFRMLFEGSRDAITAGEPPLWRFSSGNPAALKLFRAKNLEELALCDPKKLSPEKQPDGRYSAEKANEMFELALRHGSHRFEWTHLRLDGEEFQASVLLSKFEIGGKTHI